MQVRPVSAAMGADHVAQCVSGGGLHRPVLDAGHFLTRQIERLEPEGGETIKGVWSKPELVVMYRGKPEEAVLTTCKYGLSVQPWAPVTSHSVCEVEGCNGQCSMPVTS